ncbi:MAG: hypothetical protein JWO32_894 [Bacteroidetes bacterium]|nr:hypothetical protein [Bacteroidota bacterium]
MKNNFLILSIIALGFIACKKDTVRVKSEEIIQPTTAEGKTNKKQQVIWWQPIRYSDFRSAYLLNRPGGSGC